MAFAISRGFGSAVIEATYDVTAGMDTNVVVWCVVNS